jgi:hypothetical protein
MLNKSLGIVLNNKIIDSIMDKVDISESGFWEFNGKREHGYGVIKKNNKRYKVHRIMYYYYNEDNHNKIIRHLCNNKKCCNPEHLKTGSVRENARDKSGHLNLD